MAIVASDIVLRLSVKTGSAGDTTASTPDTSLGTYVSTTTMGTGANALFDDISGAENAASTVDYRCVFVLNNHATLTLQNAVVYLSSEVAGGANVTIAVDSTAISAKGASPAQALTATTEIAPGGSVTGLTYSAPTTAGAGLALGSIGPGQVKAFWVKRTATNSAAVADGVTFGISGDTAP